MIDDKLARPILVGDPEKINAHIKAMGLRMRPEVDCTIVEPKQYMEDHSVDYSGLKEVCTCVASKMLQLGDADAMVCGTDGHFHDHYHHVVEKLGIDPTVKQAAAVNVLLVKQGALFMCDTAVTNDPTAEQIAENTMLAADVVRRFGVTPRAALLSYANGDDIESPSTTKM